MVRAYISSRWLKLGLLYIAVFAICLSAGALLSHNRDDQHRTKPSVAPKIRKIPSVNTNLQSVEMVNAEWGFDNKTNMERLYIRIRNRSDKPLQSYTLEWRTPSHNSSSFTASYPSSGGCCVGCIQPGQVLTSDMLAFNVSGVDTINLTQVIFQDGSFEGSKTGEVKP
jgi:hypothetical protein